MYNRLTEPEYGLYQDRCRSNLNVFYNIQNVFYLFMKYRHIPGTKCRRTPGENIAGVAMLIVFAISSPPPRADSATFRTVWVHEASVLGAIPVTLCPARTERIPVNTAICQGQNVKVKTIIRKGQRSKDQG